MYVHKELNCVKNSDEKLIYPAVMRFILLPAIQNNNLHKHGLTITIKEPLECGFVHALFKTDLSLILCSLFITDYAILF